MAARIEPAPLVPTPRLLELRQIRVEHLDDLLEEETLAWRDELDWDFDKSAELVRRFVALRALHGCALVEGGQAIGYAYFVLEEEKALIGDLFVRREWRTPENERRLLGFVLDALIATPFVSRIESQLMMFASDREIDMPAARFMSRYERNFMLIDLTRAPLAAGTLRHRIFLQRWSEQYQDAAANLISAAYTGHVDSRINDQYRSTAGARRFLFNIVQYPGCGAFFRPASFAAFDADTGHLCGMCLASLVGPKCGHITQVCVSPDVRCTGTGYELLRQSLMVLRNEGCRKASLTVTASNQDAVALYERMGFSTIRKFSAYVWDGF